VRIALATLHSPKSRSATPTTTDVAAPLVAAAFRAIFAVLTVLLQKNYITQGL
jgi:hypothetical protein